MIFRKSFLFIALVPLVVAVVNTEDEKDEKLESLLEHRAVSPPPSPPPPPPPPPPISNYHILEVVVRLEARIRRLEADTVIQLRGRDGRDGMQGKPGIDGRNGRDGAQGPRGPRGLNGARGRNGARGPRGPRGGGVQYIRWGKTSCPQNSSLVYKGRIGGEHHTHPGGGANYVCLTEHPRYANSKAGFQSGGRMYGTEYEVSDNTQLFRNRRLHDHEAPCASCYASSRTAKLMIPGTFVCPAGWTREYWGYLMTTHYDQVHPSAFICVDRDAESAVGTHQNLDGALLYPVQGTCGSLPCNPYKQGLELTCAVCTK